MILWGVWSYVAGDQDSYIEIPVRGQRIFFNLPNPTSRTTALWFRLFWLLGRKSKLDLNNKLFIYKVAIKPIWTYGIQLWGTASTSNIEIMEGFQSKALRLITDAPWYVPNAVIRNDLQIPAIKEENTRLSSKYSAGLNTHPNHLVTQLSNSPDFRRLPSDLPYRFTQNT
jgi:hypothetical protein